MTFKLTMTLAKMTLDSRMQQLQVPQHFDPNMWKKIKTISERSSMQNIKKFPSILNESPRRPP